MNLSTFTSLAIMVDEENPVAHIVFAEIVRQMVNPKQCRHCGYDHTRKGSQLCRRAQGDRMLEAAYRKRWFG